MLSVLNPLPSVAVTIISLVFTFICVDPLPHQFVVARNFQKLDADKSDKLLSCWDEVLSSFDDMSNCLECFNLRLGYWAYSPLKKLRVRLQECLLLSNASLPTA